MPLYKYRAKETRQKIVEGNLEASSREEAIKKIDQMGFFPVKVEESTGPAPTVEVKKTR